MRRLMLRIVSHFMSEELRRQAFVVVMSGVVTESIERQGYTETMNKLDGAALELASILRLQ